jgi:hypothetical protein
VDRLPGGKNKKTKTAIMKFYRTVKVNRTLLSGCIFFLIAWAIAPLDNARAREENIPELVETFTLTEAGPRREFYDGKLIIELVSSSSDHLFKTVKVRISSDALKAEYRQEWQEHTYLEQLRHYIGNPVSGSPFKCMEGWFYYGKSAPGSATISLHAGAEPVSSIWYKFHVITYKYFQYCIIAIGWIVIAVLLYCLAPLFWSFIRIQQQARSHALKTGFESSPVPLYLIKRIPLIVCICFVIYLLFSFDWKGIVGAALMAICLQMYFNWHNRKQLAMYAAKKQMTPSGKSKKYAFTGQVKEMQVTLAINGIFLLNPSYNDDIGISPVHIHVSFIVIQVSLKNDGLNGLLFSRNKEKQYGWDSSHGEEIGEAAAKPLAELSRLPRYSLRKIEVIDGKLTAIKGFAPDTPAEIHLLTDLVVDLAASLSTIRLSK